MSELKWRVHTTKLLEEIGSNNETAVMRVPLHIFRGLLSAVATRASQLNDPELNSLMCRLALYAISDPADPEYDPELTEKVINYKQNKDEKTANQID